MTTPLVYAILLTAVTLGIPWAAASGLGFGLGRAVPALSGALLGGRDLLPHVVVLTMLTRFNRLARVLGGLAGATALMSVVALK